MATGVKEQQGALWEDFFEGGGRERAGRNGGLWERERISLGDILGYRREGGGKKGDGDDGVVDSGGREEL